MRSLYDFQAYFWSFLPAHKPFVFPFEISHLNLSPLNPYVIRSSRRFSCWRHSNTWGLFGWKLGCFPWTCCLLGRGCRVTGDSVVTVEYCRRCGFAIGQWPWCGVATTTKPSLHHACRSHHFVEVQPPLEAITSSSLQSFPVDLIALTPSHQGVVGRRYAEVGPLSLSSRAWLTSKPYLPFLFLCNYGFSWFGCECGRLRLLLIMNVLGRRDLWFILCYCWLWWWDKCKYLWDCSLLWNFHSNLVPIVVLWLMHIRYFVWLVNLGVYI